MRFKITLIASILAMFLTSAGWAGEDYTIDRSHSRVGFAVKHMLVTTVRGDFNDFSGTINFDESDITKSSVNVKIMTTSIDTDNERRDNHLRSDDFFNADNFPEITFASKSVRKTDNGLVMIGDLTIRDVTKEVEVPFEITEVMKSDRGNRFGFSARLVIKRMDYGVKWDRTLDTGGLVVSNEVTIEIDGAAVLRKENGGGN